MPRPSGDAKRYHLKKMNFNKFIKSEWGEAFKKDFAFLKNIPSSKVLSMISLCSKHKDLLTLEYLIKEASDPYSIEEELRKEVFLMQNREQNSLKFQPVNTIKSIITNQLSTSEDNEKIELLEKAQAAYENISTPKAKETRKVFFPILEDAFKSKPQNKGGGCWSISIQVNDRPVEFILDFGGRFSTMRYWIDIFPDQKPEKYVSTSYEDIMGLSEPDWDLMRSDSLEQHAYVMIEVVQRTIKAISEGLK